MKQEFNNVLNHIYTVQRWLRHADVKTAQRYADLLNMVDISEQVGRALR
jgi:integrase